MRFGVGVGCPSIRILGIHVSASAILDDPDGTMLLNALARDVSESADDTLVSSFDLDGTPTATADEFTEVTYAADSTELIFTLDPGDSLRFTLVSNSAAITTNGTVAVIVEYINVPRTQTDEGTANPSYVGYPSQMVNFTQG